MAYWDNKKGNKYRSTLVTDAVNAHLEKNVENTWDLLKEALLKLWKVNQEVFKNDLIELITGTSQLHQIQKNMLKDAIIAIDVTPNYSKNFYVDEKDIIGRLLIIIKIIKIKEAHKKYMENYEQKCAEFNASFYQSSLKALDTFINEVDNKFKILVPEYNRVLIKLRDDFKMCNDEIWYKTKQEREIEKNIAHIAEITRLQFYSAD